MASQRRRSISDRFKPIAGIFVILNVLIAPINLMMGDYTGAATSAGLAFVLWWLYRA